MKSLHFLDLSLCFYVKLEVANKYYDPPEKCKDGKNKGISIRPAGSFPRRHSFYPLG
jgi:hypothetical protein